MSEQDSISAEGVEPTQDASAAMTAPPPGEGDSAEEETNSTRPTHIIFILAGRKYAAPIERIVELERLTPLTPIPNTPRFVLGVANLHGDIVSVLDLRQVFGMEPLARRESGRMLRLRDSQGRRESGFLVDSVQGLRAVEGGEAEAVSDADLPGAWALEGVCRREDDVLHLLNVDRLFSSKPLQALRMV